LSFIVSEGYGPEGMTDDSVGVDFDIVSEISINMNLVVDDNEIETEISDDDIQVSIDTINIEVEIDG
jgi:hypothetical protein